MLHKNKIKIIPKWLLIWDIIITTLFIFKGKLLGIFYKGPGIPRLNSLKTISNLSNLLTIVFILTIVINVILILGNIGRRRKAEVLTNGINNAVKVIQENNTNITKNPTTQSSEGHMDLF